jgi:hypothetical protein
VAEVTFSKRSGGGDFYWLAMSAAQLPGTYAIAYSVSEPSLPDTLTVSQTWDTYPSGIYLFLKNTPESIDRFAANLQGFLSASLSGGMRFLWIENPDSPYAMWRTYTLRARKNGGAWSVGQLQSFDLVNYSLIIGGDCPIVLTDNPPAGQPAGFAFQRAAGLQDSLRFTSGYGLYSYPEQTNQIFLAFSGDKPGTIAFRIEVKATSDPDKSLAELDAGLRYFIKDDQFPDSDLLRSLRFPVIAPSVNVLLNGVLDVLNPLTPSRSHMSFRDQPGTSATIPSYWRTALGHAILLAPYGAASGAGSRLVFAANPAGTSALDNPPFYLTYDGPWALTPEGSPSFPDDGVLEPKERMMPGAAGTEYLGIMDTGLHYLYFVPGQPAYAPSYVPPGQGASTFTSNTVALISLDGRATTSWIYLSATGNQSIYYYAQPDDSEFYQVNPSGSGMISMARGVAAPAADGAPQGLVLLEVPAALLPAVPPEALMNGGFSAFPAVPFTGLQEEDLRPFQQIELQALSPVRRQVIRQIQSGDPSRLRTWFQLKETIPTGVTPQGLVGEFSADLLQWKSLTLAQTPRILQSQPLQSVLQALQFKNVRGKLKDAFQTNQMFLVLSDATAVLQNMSVTFRLTPDSFAEFKSSKGPDGQPIPQRVIDALVSRGIVNTFYPDLDAYDAALRAALTTADYATYRPQLLYYGAFADLNIDTWLFHVSPYHWNWSADNSTIAVFKYANRSLVDLTNDLSAWAWLEGAGGEAGALAIQRRLREIISSAIEASEQGRSDFDRFAEIAQSDSWNGILFFSVPLSMEELPAQLQGLAAGIKKERFFVHHVGINISPIKPDSNPPQIENSSLFALIDYEDTANLDYTGLDYDFKVLQFSMLFLNSQIERFSSQIQVQLNLLFAEGATLRYGETGNNLVLNGVYQQHEGKSSYVFVEQESNVFDMASFVLEEINILQAQFFTLLPDDPGAAHDTVKTRFVFQGWLRFLELERFDVFSYGSKGDFAGGLAFQNLLLEMNFNPKTPDERQFVFNATNLIVDPATSIARADSFASHFPLTFTTFLEGTPDKTPADLGYMAVTSPLDQGRIAFPWYGIVFQLDLGSLGALASAAGLKTTLLAAWSVAGQTMNVYVGLRMPGSVGAQTSIPIEGILSLNFKKIELVVESPVPFPLGLPSPQVLARPFPLAEIGNTAPLMNAASDSVMSLPQRSSASLNASVQYMLKFRGVSLKLLALTFPPGEIDVYLFGNPETGDTAQLGWYAAYVK